MCEPHAPYTSPAIETYAERERIKVIRWAAWALLGIALALEHGEEPAYTVGEVVERLGGQDGP